MPPEASAAHMGLAFTYCCRNSGENALTLSAKIIMLSGQDIPCLICMGWDSHQPYVGTHNKHVLGPTASMC